MSFGEIRIIMNKKASRTANATYNAICVYNELGQYETLLLTENDLTVARSRAQRNPEDLIHLSRLAKACLWLMRLLRLI